MDPSTLLKMAGFAAGALMLGMAAIGAALGVGNLGNSYLQAIARQPEMLPLLRTQMFIVSGTGRRDPNDGSRYRHVHHLCW